MAVAATVKPFTNRTPTLIVLNTSDNFTGSDHTGTPEVAGGVVAFPAQSGGGKFNFHDRPIIIREAYLQGTGSFVITKKVNTSTPISVTIASVNDLKEMTLLPGEWLEFTSTGTNGKSILIKAQEIPVAVGA